MTTTVRKFAVLDIGNKIPTANLGNGGGDFTKYLRGDQAWILPSLEQHPFGSMFADGVSQVVPVAAVNVYYQIPGGISGGLCSTVFVFQNSKELRCTEPGPFLATYTMTLSCPAANQQLSACVMINGTPQLNTTNRATNAGGAVKNCSLAGTGIIVLAVNDLVRLAVANRTAANNLTMQHANLTIWRME